MSVDEEVTLYTLPEQFVEFAKFLCDKDRDGSTINLYRSDYWLRQAKILDDRKLTMTDTGIAWWKYTKTELTFEEWKEFLNEICDKKGLDLAEVEDLLTNCGLPGTSDVHVPQYRDFLEGYEGKMRTHLNL